MAGKRTHLRLSCNQSTANGGPTQRQAANPAELPKQSVTASCIYAGKNPTFNRMGNGWNNGCVDIIVCFMGRHC